MLANSPAMLGEGMFWLCAAIGAFMPIFPIYLSDLGVSASDIALLTAIQPAVAILVAQMVGYLADFYLSRTRLMLYMTLGGAAVYAVFPLLPPTIPWLSVGLVGLALFVSQRLSVYNAIMFDSRRGEELYGRIRLAGSLSYVIVALLVAKMADMPAFTSAVMWPVLVIIELCLACSLLRIKDVDPQLRPGAARQRPSFREAQVRLLHNSLLLKFLLFAFLYQFFNAPVHVLQVKYLKDLGATSLVATGATAIGATAEIFAFYYGTQIQRRFRLMTLLGWMPVLLALRWGLVFAFPNQVIIAASNVLHAVTFGLFYMCCLTFLTREVPPDLKASGQTMFSIVYIMLATSLGNLGSAWLLYALGKHWEMPEVLALRWLFAAAAVGALATLAALWPVARHWQRKHG